MWDEQGNRYLDGLSALFCVNAGHGREELAEAAARQARELGFYINWSYAHPPGIELAARVADLAPGDLNRVFFTSGRLRGRRVGLEAGPQLPLRQPARASARRSSPASSRTTALRWARSPQLV